MNPLINKALDKAKLAVMSDPNFTFFTNVMLSLTHEWTHNLPTAGTDGVGIYYNPDYFMSLNAPQQKTLILHEVGHVVLDHVGRKAARNHDRYNRAGDYVINPMLQNAGCQLHPNWLYDSKYDDDSVWTTELVYDDLEDDPTPFDFSDLMDPKMSSEDAKKHLDDILVRATIATQASGGGWGCVPDEVKKYLDKLLSPKLTWFALLRRYFFGFRKLDYTFRKPNRRFFPKHILPTAYSEALDTVAIIADSSPSTSGKQFLRFVSETMGIIKTQRPREVRFVQFGWNIVSDITVRTAQEFEKVQFCGDYGTNITPVFEWINKNKPAITIIFTDGEFAPPQVTTKHPIIWVIYGKTPFTAPCGKVVLYNFDD